MNDDFKGILFVNAIDDYDFMAYPGQVLHILCTAGSMSFIFQDVRYNILPGDYVILPNVSLASNRQHAHRTDKKRRNRKRRGLGCPLFPGSFAQWQAALLPEQPNGPPNPGGLGDLESVRLSIHIISAARRRVKPKHSLHKNNKMAGFPIARTALSHKEFFMLDNAFFNRLTRMPRPAPA